MCKLCVKEFCLSASLDFSWVLRPQTSGKPLRHIEMQITADIPLQPNIWTREQQQRKENKPASASEATRLTSSAAGGWSDQVELN